MVAGELTRETVKPEYWLMVMPRFSVSMLVKFSFHAQYPVGIVHLCSQSPVRSPFFLQGAQLIESKVSRRGPIESPDVSIPVGGCPYIIALSKTLLLLIPLSVAAMRSAFGLAVSPRLDISIVLELPWAM